MPIVSGYKKTIVDAGNREQASIDKKIDRNPLTPKGITCPEGIWIKEAIVLLAEKQGGEGWVDQKIEGASQNLAHLLIVTPAIEVFSIDSFNGLKKPIARDYLRSRTAIKNFDRGFIPFSSDFHVSKTDGDFIFVNLRQFENFLNDEPVKTASNHDDALPQYIPEYLEFMLLGVKTLDLSPGNRANLDDIVEWMDTNWPSTMEGKSKHLIKYMATLMRRPQDKKGGNTAYKK